METLKFIVVLSSIFILLSFIPYAWRVAQGKIKPNIIGWSLWTVIAFSICLNYKSIGATYNFYVTIAAFICPFIITVLAIWRKWRDSSRKKINTVKKPSWKKTLEMSCVVLCLSSLILWWFWHKNPNYAQYALFLAILADAAAAIPTVLFVWKNPHDDRPFAWFMFSISYGLTIFSVTDKNLANYSLPVYMFLSSLIIMMPLVIYRIKEKIKINNWI